MELSVYNTTGNKTSRKVILKESVFGIEPSDHAIYLDVKQFLANQRQGTHKAKERNEVSGSTRKLYKQKGTGNARRGSIKSPLLRGGGRIFGPRPRDYGFKVNKKVKQLARKSALTYKARSEEILVIEDFALEAPKTKKFLEILGNLKINDRKTLLVLTDPNTNILLSSRNVKNTRVVTASELNTYDILNAKNVLFAESSLAKVEEILS